jgi:hypothetical protein
VLEDDVVPSLSAIRSGRRSTTDWLRSMLRGVRELQWFAADDPGPGLMWFRDGLRLHPQAGFTRIANRAGESANSAV